MHEYHGHCTLNPRQVVLKNGFNRVFVRPNNTLEATAVKIYLDQDFYSHAEGCGGNGDRFCISARHEEVNQIVSKPTSERL